MVQAITTDVQSGKPVRGLSNGFSTSANGWPPRPFEIVSVLEVLEFNAGKFMTLFGHIEYCIAWAEEKDGTEVVEDDNRQAIIEKFAEILTECETLGLGIAATLVRGSKFNLSFVSETLKPNFRDVVEEARTVKRVIKAELYDRKFLMIPQSDVQYYTTASLFGEDVNNNFSDAAYDIAEAGKCMATGRSTACVLHLMRVLEFGLNSLANYFQVQFAHVNWNQIIDQVESKIRNIDKDPNKPANWQEDRKFYSEAANQFQFFKNSWRNYAMHIHDKYTPEEALIIYTSVKVFMDRIAKRLKQP